MFNPLNLFRTIATGVVIGKDHYPAGGGSRETLTSFNKGAVFTSAVTPTDGWSLVVQGTDKTGKHFLTKEFYVDPMMWGNTPIGSKWPPVAG
jgi:hypothetical protein